MALGGGSFLTQNKTIPGTYINFVSASRASATLSDRGVVTMPLLLDWGEENSVFAVTNGQFQKDSLKLFGYAYTHERLKGLRDLFANCKTGYFYRLNSGGTKAENSLAKARYGGARGNALRIIIKANEAYSEEAPLYDVSTTLDTAVVDLQKGIAKMGDLKANDFVEFIPSAELSLTAGMPLTGGTDKEADPASYQTYLDKIESYSFNTMGCLSTEETIKGLFVNFTKRMRDEMGIKFQTVLFRHNQADSEGVISVENGLAEDGKRPELVYWLTGAQAGCGVNQSLTNAVYTGEYEIETEYTQAELEKALLDGKLMLHRVGDEVRVLSDVNTFTSITDGKSADFSSNQTVRVLDQIGNDIAVLFQTKYLGKVPNDNAGRISLWNDIVKHHQELQTLRAIEGFTSEAVAVLKGDSKKAVIVTDKIMPVNAMEQLYMTVTVE